jgi:predicted kinase
MLIIPVGISGSGKSFVGELLEKDFNFSVVCPDDIRKELTGNISDQSKNNEVFQLAHERIIKLLSEGKKNVYFSATNVGYIRLYDFIDYINSQVSSVRILIFLMKDSLNVNLCFARIQQQLKDDVERSEIRNLDILYRQLTNFKNVFGKIGNIENEYSNTETYLIRNIEDVHNAIRQGKQNGKQGFDN